MNKAQEILAEILTNGDKIFKEKKYSHNIKTVLKNNSKNLIINADCLNTIEYLRSMGKKVDLIYIDPPFTTGKKFDVTINLLSGEEITKNCYVDQLKKYEFLLWFFEVLANLKTVLKEEGSIFVHLDQRIVHEVKILMDIVFSEKNFVNEIIWSYKSGGASSKSFSKKHDVILFYAFDKEKKIFNTLLEKSYNRDFKPYRFKGVEEFQDEIGFYTKVNMKDVWNINMVGRTSKERVKYPSQKPFELLKRIILSSTNEGMTALDVFGGSGALANACEILNRNYIHSDISSYSCSVAMERLKSYSFLSEIECNFKTSIEDGKVLASLGEIEMKSEFVKRVLVSNDGVHFETHENLNLIGFKYIYVENILGENKIIGVDDDRKI